MSNYPVSRQDPAILRKAANTRLPCPVEGCPGSRSQGKMMCLPCWWRVPAELRVEVYVSWRAYLGATQPTAAVSRKANALEAYERYRKAKAAALEAAAEHHLTPVP